MKKGRWQNIFYSVLALFFSLVLFFNANDSVFQSNLMATSTNYENTITDVPIQVTYDSDKYFIQGFESTVSVELSSANRIQLNAESNEETRKFRVVADLSSLGVGTHEVSLKIENLSSGVSATIDPAKVTITIEEKVTQEFEIESNIDTSGLTDGYQIDTVTIAPKTVEITTGDKTLAEIDRVVATVNSSALTDEDVTVDAEIQALDKNGDLLAIIADPNQVQVQITLSAPQKEVELYVTQQGVVPSNVSHYIFRMSQINAQISGGQSLLEPISQIAVPVDISGVVTAETRTVTIPVEDGLTVTPTEVRVEIIPVAQTTDTTNTTTNGQSGNSTNNQSGSAASNNGQETTSSETTSEDSSSESSNSSDDGSSSE